MIIGYWKVVATMLGEYNKINLAADGVGGVNRAHPGGLRVLRVEGRTARGVADISLTPTKTL